MDTDMWSDPVLAEREDQRARQSAAEATRLDQAHEYDKALVMYVEAVGYLDSLISICKSPEKRAGFERVREGYAKRGKEVRELVVQRTATIRGRAATTVSKKTPPPRPPRPESVGTDQYRPRSNTTPSPCRESPTIYKIGPLAEKTEPPAQPSRSVLTEDGSESWYDNGHVYSEINSPRQSYEPTYVSQSFDFDGPMTIRRARHILESDSTAPEAADARVFLLEKVVDMETDARRIKDMAAARMRGGHAGAMRDGEQRSEKLLKDASEIKKLVTRGNRSSRGSSRQSTGSTSSQRSQPLYDIRDEEADAAARAAAEFYPANTANITHRSPSSVFKSDSREEDVPSPVYVDRTGQTPPPVMPVYVPMKTPSDTIDSVCLDRGDSPQITGKYMTMKSPANGASGDLTTEQPPYVDADTIVGIYK
eukprot:m.452619 g.452619  ORF g.452619 m.452619 type:complete len:422 (-) comp20368_c0_seq1:1354-2619(-)